MAKKFDSDTFFKNINYLLKAKGIKIGELESYAEVSTGYVSRVKKEENSKPGIDFIVKVAEKFEVTVDDLIGVEMEKLTNTENYIINFLNKLIEDTQSEKLMWERESPDYLGHVETDQYGNPYHDLLSIQEVTFINGRVQTSRDAIVFDSNSFGVQTRINGDCYNLRLKNDATLYLMDIAKIPTDYEEEVQYAKEILMILPKRGRQFLCSSTSNVFKEKIDTLFATITEYFQHPLIKTDFRNIIDAFMQDDLQDDNVTVAQSPDGTLSSDVPLDTDVPFNTDVPFDEEVPF